jgi:hypothetical protein
MSGINWHEALVVPTRVLQIARRKNCDETRDLAIRTFNENADWSQGKMASTFTFIRITELHR